ncbi:hypothetical protein [Nocardioides soli]|uniref:Uncharacterized protein n=1 Tax=Nocardioides soli TaxID=1036020 RepID=A0A7W4W0J4_9ACTN|nr:hypothetical protein [Nocardioides soli]MBB3045174.1 hypothetical protein [Nocardioides soli]
MNEQQMVALVERVGETLEPDVGRLVAGAAARGRVRRGRRRLAGAAGAAVAVVATATAAPLLVVGGGTGAGVATAPGESPRELAVAAGDMSAALATLLPGSRVVADDQPYQFQVQRGVVRWRGGTVTVAIDTRSAGVSTPARERCLAFAGGPPCAAMPGGVWLFEHGRMEFDARTGEEQPLQDHVRAYVPGGFVVDAYDDGAASVGRRLLRTLALDGVWWVARPDTQ